MKLASGDVAQVGERYVRNVQARGSSPLISTIFLLRTDTGNDIWDVRQR